MCTKEIGSYKDLNKKGGNKKKKNNLYLLFSYKCLVKRMSV